MSFDTLQELDSLGISEDYPYEAWSMVELEDEPLDETGIDPFWHVVYTPRINGIHTESLSVYGIRAAAALHAEMAEAGFHVAWNADDGFGKRNFLCESEQEAFDEELQYVTR